MDNLDYSFGEDDNTTIDQNAFNNFSILNKMALSLHKLAQPLMKNCSIRRIRKGFSWATEESLSLILGAFDEDVLKNALENAQKLKNNPNTPEPNLRDFSTTKSYKKARTH